MVSRETKEVAGVSSPTASTDSPTRDVRDDDGPRFSDGIASGVVDARARAFNLEFALAARDAGGVVIAKKLTSGARR